MDSREPDAPRETWVIRQGDLYHRANRCGYSRYLYEAGLYTREEAKRVESYRRVPLDRAIHISQLATEVKALGADIDARKDGLARLVKAQLFGSNEAL